MQLEYKRQQDEAMLGMKGGTFMPENIISKLASADIGIGRPVELDSEEQCKPLAVLANFAGVALLRHGMVQSDEGVVSYKDKEMVAVMQKGRVWCEAGEALAVGVQCVFGTDGKVVAGANAAKYKAYVVKSAAADGDLVLVELSGYQGADA